MIKFMCIVIILFGVISCSTIDKGISLYSTAKKIIPVMKQTIQNDPQLDITTKEQCLLWIKKYELFMKSDERQTD